ncbi:hypothetical protein NDA16_003412 [Ustilago loliicola]|nr:hypothetical protein NDA16_003412 [Ustilago loliicola]
MSDNAAGPSSGQLPPGWTSHISPTGRTYYHNADSGLSTYHPPHLPKPKREKPVSKTPIPSSSGWYKITTNKDNVFYFHPETKASEWLPPAQIAAAVQAMEEHEVREKERLKQEQEVKEREERERVNREKRERKRKAEEGVPITEFDALAKRARAGDEDDEEMDEESIASSDDAQDQTQIQDTLQANDDDAGDDDDEEWQRQIAEQMAAEAEAEAAAAADAETDTQPPPARTPTPDTAQVEASASLEDLKSAFIAHLTSLNGTPSEVNPMAPWDLEQPKFFSHPSFHTLPQREREDVFNEWCKLRIREKRAAKASSSAAAAPTASSKSSRADPLSKSAEDAFRKLLKQEVRSTRTKYSDFKAAFARDFRFSSYGKSDGDREKLFKTHLIELGEQKRAAAEEAEREFLDLLSDKIPGNYRNKVATAKGQAASKGKGAERDATMAVWVEAKRSPGKIRLFHEHQQRLSSKQESKIGSVFAKYATKLDTEPEDVMALTLQDEELSHPPLQVYREDKRKLEAAYEKWDAERKRRAEREFKEMLAESAFVDFWGRLKKEVHTGLAGNDGGEEKKREAREEGEDEDGEEGDGTTLLDMARKMDLGEIESVLRNDARFRAWKHVPERRRRWIREHLEGLAAPGKSVHR